MDVPTRTTWTPGERCLRPSTDSRQGKTTVRRGRKEAFESSADLWAHQPRLSHSAVHQLSTPLPVSPTRSAARSSASAA